MTAKELKKLNRRELLEMLIIQTQRVEELENSIASLNEQIKNRELAINNAGSIAEASLKVSGVFEDAEAAAQIYIDNIKRLDNGQTEICRQLEEDSRAKVKKLISDTERLCRDRERKADEYFENTINKLRQFFDTHSELKELLKSDGMFII